MTTKTDPREGATCCGKPLVRMVYLSSFSGSRKPILVCQEFVRQHPNEFAEPDHD